jgi:HSP20 family protein
MTGSHGAAYLVGTTFKPKGQLEMVRDDTTTSVPVRRPLPAFTEQLFEPFGKLRSEIDRVFEEFPSRMPAFRFGRLGWGTPVPALEMTETDDAYKLTAELPGMDAGNIEVTVADGILTINGEKKEEREEKEKDYYFSERNYGAFERSMKLPSDAAADKITAKSKDGVLTITMPKDQNAAAHKRRIAIEDK